MRRHSHTHGLDLMYIGSILAAAFLAAAEVRAGTPWATGQVRIVGTRLSVSPAVQTVPLGTPTVVNTSLAGSVTPLPSDLGQPKVFLSGRHEGIWQFTRSGVGELTWFLDGGAARILPGSLPACPTEETVEGEEP